MEGKPMNKSSAFYPGQKALIVSGYADHDEISRALKLGVGDFIKSPMP